MDQIGVVIVLFAVFGIGFWLGRNWDDDGGEQ
jgi:hypothetical protein